MLLKNGSTSYEVKIIQNNLKMLRFGPIATDEKIKEDFLMWCNCNGKRELGLYRRQYDEFKMYKDADYTRIYREF